MGAELLDQHLGVDTQLLDRLGLQRLDAQALLGARHLVAMDRVGEVAQVVTERPDLTPHQRQRRIALRAASLGVNPLGGRLFQCTGHTLHGVCRAATDRDRDRGLALATLPARCGTFTGCELCKGSRLQRLHPALHGTGAFLARTQAQAKLGLGCAGLGCTALESVAFVARGLFVARFGARVIQPLA